jgi:hypothetical protein
MIYKTKLLSQLLTIVFFITAFAVIGKGQASRTWVSGVGDDANPCSRTAPCKTFAGTISKTATNGEINIIDSGGFGTVNITKSITIDASPFLGGVLSSGGATGFIINAPNAVVTLRGLDINGFTTGNNGIRILEAKAVNIENCAIYGFTNNGIVDERDNGGALNISNTIVKNVSQAGILINGVPPPSLNPTLVNAVLDNVRLMDSNVGLSVSGGNVVTIRNSVISGNTTHGILADNSANNINTSVIAESSVVSGNQTGIGISSGTAVVRISNLTITKNLMSLNVGSGQIISFGNNRITGNKFEYAPSSTVTLQ